MCIYIYIYIYQGGAAALARLPAARSPSRPARSAEMSEELIRRTTDVGSELHK